MDREHVAFQMTPRLPDLDMILRPFMLDQAFSAWDKDQYSADEARIPQKYQNVIQEFAVSLAGYFSTTANMDMKLI